ncbi:histidinol-phosphatase [Salinactinospora qingdaonensis]|uniref:Histidinol-phosphatase n=1 Tax=Salinactinospora qingdaonensis TaxID=702744 RepID=A0ABP7GLH4_9ACTN
MAAFDDDLRLAHVLADAADDISLKHFRDLDLKIDTKPDLTPVTEADRAVEETLRSVLSRARPRDAVLGEEYGKTGHSPRLWVLDPIDGTKNYVRGVPVWATLIALLEVDRPVVGLVSSPALSRRWWASKGGGTWTGRSLTKASRCQVSGITELADASLSFSSLTGWEEQHRLEPFLGLTRSVWRTRAYGDFWSHVMVAEGSVDISAEPELSLWDAAPLPIILEEAGGRATDLRAGAFSDGGALVCSNGALHDAALTQLNGGPTPLRLT